MKSPLSRSASLSVAIALAGIAFSLYPSRTMAAGPGQSTTKVAVVDVRRAVMETEDGLRAQASLKKFFDRRQAELNIRQEELARKKEEIEKQSKVLSQQALQRAMDEWQKQMTDLQAMFMGYNQELQRKEREITDPIYARVAAILRKLAHKEGYDLILERQAVPYARGELDVTDSVISLYNAGDEGAPDATPQPKGSAAPAPTAPPAPPAASSAPSK